MSIFQRVYFVFFGLCLIATVGCGGGAFEAAGGEQPDANSDVQVDSDADAKPEADAHHDAKPEADAAVPDAPDAQAQEPQPEAGEDAAEEPDVSPSDVQIPDVATEDSPPLTFCEKWGTDGFITVVVQVGVATPSSKVLALYGTVKHTVADAGANLPYSVWKFGQAGETQIVALPIAELHNLELLFAWGFTGPGNMNFNSWDMRCTATGCNVNDIASVCAGKEFLGSFDHGQFKPGIGTCTSKLNGSMTVTEVDCFVD